MTPVHVNRILGQLRAEGLVDIKGRVLTILDPRRLKEVAQYDPRYLHLIRTERRDGEVSARAGDLVRASGHGLVHDAIQKVKDSFSGS
jgi:hypothetical protein